MTTRKILRMTREGKTISNFRLPGSRKLLPTSLPLREIEPSIRRNNDWFIS